MRDLQPAFWFQSCSSSRGMKAIRLTTIRASLSLLVFAAVAAATGCTVSSQSRTINTPPATLVSISVGPANSNLVVDQTLQLSATGTYSDTSTHDITSLVSWSVTPSGIATISSSGLLTAQQSGQASISASYKSKSGSLQLTIAPKLVSIAVSPSSAKIAPKTQQQFVATGTYSDKSTQNITASVDWTSSSPSVADLSGTTPGLVTAQSAGKTTITATVGSISGSGSLTVSSATPTALAISPDPANMSVFVSQQFTATASFDDGTSQDVTNVSTWTSSASQTVSVTGTGLVSAKAVTSSPVTISATFSSVSGNSAVTVDAKNLSSIVIGPNTPIAPASKVQLTATGTFSDGSTHNITSQVAWSTSDTTGSVITFVSGSTVQGVAAGQATITATLTSSSGAVSGSIAFTVTNASIQSVTVTPAASTIPVQGHANLSATGAFSDGSTQDITTSVAWSSGNASVATVGSSGSSFGVVNGVSAGTTSISAGFPATAPAQSGSASLTVSGATLQSISIAPATALLAPGSTRQYTVIGKWSDGSTQPISQNITWQETDTSGNNVALVSASGVVTGNAAGTATITAKFGTLSPASASVVVEGAALNCIQVAPQGTAMASSCSQVTTLTEAVPDNIEFPFEATGIFADGEKLDLTAAATWTSSSASVATVSNGSGTGGVATGMSQGTTTISAVFAGQTGTATLNVTNATLTSITVSPSSASIALGSSQQFTAQGKFSDNSTLAITNQVNWTSSNPGVAVIKSTGIANSASSGTTTIKASLNGVSGTAILTVQ
jgi:hypothetical protein